MKNIIKFSFRDLVLLLSTVLIFASIQLPFALGWRVYLVHFIIFAPFGIYLYFKKYSFFITLIFVASLSAMGEVSQKLFFHRIAEVIDVIIDSFSAGVGWLLMHTMRLVKKAKND